MWKAVDTAPYPEDKNVVAGPENFNKDHYVTAYPGNSQILWTSKKI